MAPKARKDAIGKLIGQRVQAVENMERIHEFITKNSVILCIDELECRLEILETYFAQALDFQTAIEDSDCASENAMASENRGTIEDLYCKCRTLIKRSINEAKVCNEPKQSPVAVSVHKFDHLPKLKLPTFSGVYAEFPNFKRLFTRLVHDEVRLSTIEKFNHLLSCLSGPALRTIKAVDVVDENYEIAWNLLIARFDNKYLLCQEHIQELFKLKPIQKRSPEQLRLLIDTVAARFNSLLSILNHEEISNALILNLVLNALDSESQEKVNESIDYSKAYSWGECAEVLTKYCQTLETTNNKTSPGQQQPSHSAKNKFNSRNTKSLTVSSTSNNCKLCHQADHHIWRCAEFLNNTPIQRFATVKELSLCINCLSPQHTVRNCKSSKCKHCQGAHHSLLHRADDKQNKPQSEQLSQSSSSSQSTAQQASSPATSLVGQQVQPIDELRSTDQQDNHVILATAVVRIVDKFGVPHSARALLDSASQLNFITSSLTQKLKLNKSKSPLAIGGIGNSSTNAKFSTNASIQSCNSNYTTSLQFVVLPQITGVHPEHKIDIKSWTLPPNTQLADSNFNIPHKIDLLIGTDIFFNLLCGKQFQIKEHGPTIVETKLGWVVAGKCRGIQNIGTSLVVAPPATEPNLESLVSLFWELEKVPDIKPKLSKEHSECEEHFIRHTKRLECGRFMVKLPFKADPTVLGNSKHMATRRFISLEKRLNANSDIKHAYSEFLQQYESDGHMRQVKWPNTLDGYFFLPHHCVLRPDKTTTKCRVVFDASAKAANNISLNDILKVGPVVQNDLVDILLRFRLNKYALMADITAMYRQISVCPEDRNVQNILWRENVNEDLKMYTLNTVTYGTASAPYLATRCLIELGNDNVVSNPAAANIVKNDFYVDDLITGGSSLEQIQTIKTDVSSILSQGCFTLRKWYSNHQAFLSSIPTDDREKPITINDANVVKTLGVIWDADADCFKFSYYEGSDDNTALSKRKVLAEMAKLFDPLGLIKPIIVKAKVFLQELWLKQLTWDETIPAECAEVWFGFVKQLEELNYLKIPRYVMRAESSIELHGFADASTRAYGCCLYIRCINSQGTVTTNLFTSRSKVAPISTVRTIPCLELCAAHLLVQLFQKVRNMMHFENIYFWSDSVIVLCWLAEHASSLNTFVANRVAYIQEHAAGVKWKYVPSSSNPADLVSRGSTVAELTKSIWFSGPAFLEKPLEFWPQNPKQLSLSELPHRKVTKTALITTENGLLTEIYSKNSFNTICIRFAYIRRFIANCRHKAHLTKILVNKGEPSSKVYKLFDVRTHKITIAEKDDAFMQIVVILQQVHYGNDIKLLKSDTPLLSSGPLKDLNAFIEAWNHGYVLLKVGGRLKKADLPYAAKCPIILPKDDVFIKSYAEHVHRTNFHAGAQALVGILRQRFWIIGARDYARQTVKSCVLCFKYRPKLLSQIMGNLPKDRVTPVKPFTNCGVDFCGPITTTWRLRGKPTYKTYIAVFVCFVTHAVHLEVVSALTSDAFIAALKRFIGRRGLCTNLYCDNATNFVGARNTLHELKATFLHQKFQKELTTWCVANNIEFKHIPPRAPHFGGIWEAAVKSAKTLLYKAMQSATLTFEELTTVTAQIEGILNSRPLTALSTDPSDEQALTPAHFLNQSLAECIAEPLLPFNQISQLKHWQRISAIQQHFWARWSREYISSMQKRRKWASNIPNITVGTLVIVHEDNLPPQKWLLGRVTNVIKGDDNKVRVADVKTQAGTVRRPIVKLAALPVDASS